MVRSLLETARGESGEEYVLAGGRVDGMNFDSPT